MSSPSCSAQHGEVEELLRPELLGRGLVAEPQAPPCGEVLGRVDVEGEAGAGRGRGRRRRRARRPARARPRAPGSPKCVVDRCPAGAWRRRSCRRRARARSRCRAPASPRRAPGRRRPSACGRSAATTATTGSVHDLAHRRGERRRSTAGRGRRSAARRSSSSGSAETIVTGPTSASLTTREHVLEQLAHEIRALVGVEGLGEPRLRAVEPLHRDEHVAHPRCVFSHVC